MKCRLCSKRLTKGDYWAGIRYSRLLFFIFGYVTDLFVLLYWRLCNRFIENLNEKTEFMHLSCFRLQSCEKKRFYIHPITYTQYGRKIIYYGIAFYFAAFFFYLFFLIDIFMENGMSLGLSRLIAIIFMFGLVAGMIQLILLNMAARQIRHRLGFDRN